MVSLVHFVGGVESLSKGRLERPYKNWQAPRLGSHPVLILCSTEAEAEYAIGRTEINADALVALTPQAACQFYLRGISYYRLEDFFDVTAFWDGDEAMLSFQGQWADQVDAFLSQAVPELRDPDLRPAGSYFFWLKMVSDTLYRTVFGLAHLLLATQPRHVYYFGGARDIDDLSSPLGPEALVFDTHPHSFVLPLCAAEYGTSLTALPAQPRGVSAQGLPDGRARITTRRLFQALPGSWQDALRRARRHATPAPGSRTAARREEGPELILGSAFDLTGALLQEHGFKITPIENVVKSPAFQGASVGPLDRQLADAWAELRVLPFFREPFVWCGVDVFGLAESRLRYWLEAITPNMWNMCTQARERFERQRPGAILFYSPWSPLHFAVIQAARSLGIPVVTHQHGSFEIEYSTLDMIDMRVSDYRLVYGAGQVAYLAKRAVRYAEKRAEVLAVGSSYIDALANAPDRRADTRQELGVADRDQLVVYIPTSYQYNWYMARQSYLATEYFGFLTKVIETFSRFPQLRFIYKPFPEFPTDPITKVIAERCPNCKVTNLPPPRLFQASDMIILDIPSTALLEASLTDKPIFVFSDRRCIALRPEARDLIRKRATLGETPEDFLEQLGSFLGTGQFRRLDRPNREFLQVYGTHEDDGRSAHRASAALRDIICTHDPLHSEVLD